MINHNSNVCVASKIPKHLRFVLGKAIKDSVYLNISEFVRQAVKEKLGREGFLSAQIT
jgi:Arc/MetJ-type ribon-helix-helix transcriptional regulator